MSTGCNTSFLELDDFTQGYVECMLWAECDRTDDQGGDPLDKNYDFDDFTPLLRAAVLNDCNRFQIENAEELKAAKAAKGFESLHRGTAREPVLAHAGHDFWLTRMGSGAGFLDGDWPEAIAERLNKYCEGAGEVNLWITDEGKVDVD